MNGRLLVDPRKEYYLDLIIKLFIMDHIFVCTSNTRITFIERMVDHKNNILVEKAKTGPESASFKDLIS